jgi:hypothetical protein
MLTASLQFRPINHGYSCTVVDKFGVRNLQFPIMRFLTEDMLNPNVDGVISNLNPVNMPHLQKLSRKFDEQFPHIKE